jgi:serine/threonine protein kinase
MNDQTAPDQPLEPSESPLLLDRYREERQLGIGGMGSVVLAEDTRLPRKVAIKCIKEGLSRDENMRKRIERECALHAQVGNHPHIVTLHDKVEADGRIHLVMEYVKGEPLDELLAQYEQEKRPFPRADALTIAAQVLDALSDIHAHNIVHRDIKPSNILVMRTSDGAVCGKLTDFGIARPQDDTATRLTTSEGASPGTPLYMAPEQIDPGTFGELSRATDVYSMGIVLYHLLTGAPPFEGTITEVLNQHLSATPASLEGKLKDAGCIGLNNIIARATAKKPSDRYPSVAAFRAEVLSALAHGGQGVKAKPPTDHEARTQPIATAKGTAPKRKSGVIAAIAILVSIPLLLIFGIVSIIKLMPNRPSGESATSGEQLSPAVVGVEESPVVELPDAVAEQPSPPEVKVPAQDLEDASAIATAEETEETAEPVASATAEPVESPSPETSVTTAEAETESPAQSPVQELGEMLSNEPEVTTTPPKPKKESTVEDARSAFDDVERN